MKDDVSADTLQFTGPVLMNRLFGRQPHSFYKAALFINDYLLSMLALSGCALIFAENIDLVHNFSQPVDCHDIRPNQYQGILPARN